MNQEIRELILDQKDRGKESFDALDDDVQNQIVSAIAREIPACSRFECIEDMSLHQLDSLIAFNDESDYMAMGKIMSEVLRQNMEIQADAEYESTTEDHEAANVDDRIDAIQAKAVGL